MFYTIGFARSQSASIFRYCSALFLCRFMFNGDKKSEIHMHKCRCIRVLTLLYLFVLYMRLYVLAVYVLAMRRAVASRLHTYLSRDPMYFWMYDSFNDSFYWRNIYIPPIEYRSCSNICLLRHHWSSLITSICCKTGLSQSFRFSEGYLWLANFITLTWNVSHFVAAILQQHISASFYATWVYILCVLSLLMICHT